MLSSILLSDSKFGEVQSLFKVPAGAVSLNGIALTKARLEKTNKLQKGVIYFKSFLMAIVLRCFGIPLWNNH